MGGSTRTLTSTSNQTTSPWAPAIPGLQQLLGDANSLYSAGVGSGVYAGPRVAQMGDDTLTGLQSMRDQAAADNAGAIGTSFAQTLLGNGGGISYNGPSLDGNGLSSGTSGALANLQGVQGVDTSRLTSLANEMADPNSGVNTTAASFMNGSRDLTTIPQLQSLYDKSQQTSAAETNLSGVASGKFLDPTTNPYLQAAVAASNQNVANAQKEAFAASGRYGSGSFAGATAKAINDTDTTLYANQYNQERANQMAANSQIDTARQAATSLGTNITGAIGNVESTNNTQRLAGAGLAQAQNAARAGVEGQILGGNEFNSSQAYQKAAAALGTYQQGTANAMSNEQNRVGTALSSQGQALSAAGMLPALDALRYSPGQMLLGVGGALQGQDQANIDAAQQSYNEVQQAPWAELSRYGGIVGGIGGMGGTTTGTQTQQVPQPGLGQTLLGGALGIGGLAANLGRSGLFGGASAAAGAAGGSSLLGSLGSLFALSDGRAKENVRPVGRLADGQIVHAYNYKGDPRTQIGLIAQEVAQHVPDAVGEMPGMGGLLGVDYARATARAAEMERRAA